MYTYPYVLCVYYVVIIVWYTRVKTLFIVRDLPGVRYLLCHYLLLYTDGY